MPADDVPPAPATPAAAPFELIAQPARTAATHDAVAARQLLARRQPPPLLGSHARAALRYKASDELLLALNMALHTGSPLLLTGEPGTGKTQAADFVAAYFGIPIYKFLVKSTSTAQDLLYEFDAVGYLHWAQSARAGTPRAAAAAPAPAGEAAMSAVSREAAAIREGFLHRRALWQAYETNGDSVILIDEIDKASRDFPNDLLHELDQHSFPHPFDQEKWVAPQSERRPIVIITSNEERRLPDAFLRRCIFHRIELTPALVADAVDSMAGDGGNAFPQLDAATRAAAQRRFWDIRGVAGVDKKPSTAELLTWLAILSARRVTAEKLRDCRLADLPALGALIKDAEDQRRLG